MAARGQSLFASRTATLNLAVVTDVSTPDCIGLFIETGGVLRVNYTDGSSDTLTVPDGFTLNAFVASVGRNVGNGGVTTAAGVHALY